LLVEVRLGVDAAPQSIAGEEAEEASVPQRRAAGSGEDSFVGWRRDGRMCGTGERKGKWRRRRAQESRRRSDLGRGEHRRLREENRLRQDEVWEGSEGDEHRVGESEVRDVAEPPADADVVLRVGQHGGARDEVENAGVGGVGTDGEVVRGVDLREEEEEMHHV
jgi:hypothetical protein